MNLRQSEKMKRSDGFFDSYQRLKAINNFIEKVARKNPDLVSLISIGKTVEKRDMKLIKIGANHKSNTKPIIWLDAGLHSREWVSITSALYIIERLISAYRSGQPTVKKLLSMNDFYILPVGNPDGYEYSWTKVWPISLLSIFHDNKLLDQSMVY